MPLVVFTVGNYVVTLMHALTFFRPPCRVTPFLPLYCRSAPPPPTHPPPCTCRSGLLHLGSLREACNCPIPFRHKYPTAPPPPFLLECLLACLHGSFFWRGSLCPAFPSVDSSNMFLPFINHRPAKGQANRFKMCKSINIQY